MFDMLTGLFYQVVLQTNIWKTVVMFCQTCRAVRVQADEAYKLRIMGEGQSYQERQHEMVQCLKYGKDLVMGSLDTHCQTLYSLERDEAGKK